jgi:hypothetical protein
MLEARMVFIFLSWGSISYKGVKKSENLLESTPKRKTKKKIAGPTRKLLSNRGPSIPKSLRRRPVL